MSSNYDYPPSTFVHEIIWLDITFIFFAKWKKNQTFSNGEDVPAKLLSERGIFFFLFIYPHGVVWINNEWCKMDVTIHLDQILISLIFSYFSTNQFSLKENKKYWNLSCVITGGVWESMKSLFFFFLQKVLKSSTKDNE